MNEKEKIISFYFIFVLFIFLNTHFSFPLLDL